jgi:hypothetical protein
MPGYILRRIKGLSGVEPDFSALEPAIRFAIVIIFYEWSATEFITL